MSSTSMWVEQQKPSSYANTQKNPIQITQWLLSPLAPLLAEWVEGTKGGKRDQREKWHQVGASENSNL